MQDSSVTITITAIDGATKVFQGVGDIAVKQATRAAAAFQKLNEVTNVQIESTGKLGSATGRAASQQDKLTASTRRGYFAQTALTTVLSAGINKAFLEMVDVTGQAIQRVDILSQFPASIAALGVSATDASSSLKILSGYVGQIGGNLQDAAISVTRFTEVTKNVKAATAEFIGVNNALIAGGAPAEIQKSALEQLTQAYSRGVPQLIEWRSLMVAMPAQLTLVAKAMHQPSAQALGEQLTNGKISMQDFLTELTKLSTGTGPILTQAQARMNGIQFAFNRFKNTMVEGMTSIIQTIGRQNIIDFFNVLSGVMRELAVFAVQLLSVLFNLFNVISGVFGGPQLKLAKDDTAAVADNLGAGAGAAGDMADNLADADKQAKKSLASFDKMNVLEPPKAAKSNAGPVPLSPADATALSNILDGVDTKLANVNTSAKILAGIIAGLVGIKFAEGLLNQFNGVAKTISETNNNLKKLKDRIDALNKSSGEGGGFKKLTTSVKDLGSTVVNIGAALISVFSNNKLFEAVAKFGKFLLVPFIGLADVITGVFGAIGVALGAALGVPLGVAVALTVGAVVAIIAAIWLIYKNWDTIWKGIQQIVVDFSVFMIQLWQGLVSGLKSVWKALYDVLAGPFKAVANVVSGLFIAFVALAAVEVQAIVGFFVGMARAIVNAFTSVVGFTFNNVFVPIIKLYTDLLNGIIDIFTGGINFIFTNILAPIASWINVNVIQPTFGLFQLMWINISGFAFTFTNNLKNFLGPLAGWIYANVIVPIANVFSGLWDGIRNGLANMVGGLSSIFNGILGALKTIVNGMVDIFNQVIDGINALKVPDWVPKLGGKTPGIHRIPQLATGGVITQPTLAQVGEQGSEAIVPLENNTAWIDKLAAKIGNVNTANHDGDMRVPSKLDRQQSTNNITIQVSGVFATSVAEQRKVADLIAKRINESTGLKSVRG
jgi:tape measure domain-containing protein